MKIAVVGAGFTGLAAAFDLTVAGHQVTVYETAGKAGGLASGFKKPNWDWYLEKYYHHWFTSDQAIRRFLHEAGLSRRLIYRRPLTAVCFQNSFYPFDSPASILSFPGLSFPDKFRFAAVTAYLKYLASWQPLESKLAVPWLSAYYGSRPYQLLWAPLLNGKFGPYVQKVNMAWMWARLKARTSSLGTYRGGFQACLNDLTDYLTHQGVVFHFRTLVTEVKRSSQDFSLLTSHSNSIFNQVLLTTPPLVSQKLATFLPSAYLSPILKQPYLSALTLILCLSRQLAPHNFYWLNLPKNQGFPFLALVEHTNFVSPRHFGGNHLIYCGDYLPPNHPYLNLNQKELLALYLPGIQKVNPNFKTSWINQSWVFRADYAQPVPSLYHSQYLPPIQSPIKGLFLASMAQVYPWDRGTNFAVDLGRRAARMMLSS